MNINREKILKFLNTFKQISKYMYHKKWYEQKGFIKYYDLILLETSFLSTNNLKERIFYIKNNYFDIQRCSCGKQLLFKQLKLTKTCGNIKCRKSPKKYIHGSLYEKWIGRYGYEVANNMIINYKNKRKKNKIVIDENKIEITKDILEIYKDKISKWSTNKKQSIETRLRRYITRKNNNKEWHSIETKIKIANTNKKTHNSIEFKINNPYREETKVKQSLKIKEKILNNTFTPNTNNRRTSKTLLYDNIKFRSSWEICFWILNRHDNLYYEKLRIPYTYNKKEFIYIIDFIDEKNKILYEIKPKKFLDDKKFLKKYEAAIEWCNNNNYTYKIIDEDWFIENIKFLDLEKYKFIFNKISKLIVNNYKDISEWEVYTPTGWSNFKKIKRTAKTQKLKIILENKILECSLNHKIKMSDNTFKYAKDLKIGELIYNDILIIDIILDTDNFLFYDLIDVEKNNEYYTNDIVSHNCAFIPGFGETIWESIFPVLSTGGDAIILSTPFGASGWFAETYTKAKLKLNDFNAIELPYWLHPDYDEKWAEAMKKTMPLRKFKQEYCCHLLGSGNTIVDLEKLDTNYSKKIKEPIEKRMSDMLWIWEVPIESEKYLLSSDVSRGDGSDFSTFIITKISTGEQVAEFKGQLSTDSFAAIIYENAYLYNQALVAVENNSYGWAVIMTLKNELKYTNIYYSQKGESFNEFINPFNSLSRRNKTVDMVEGFTTSTKTRPIVFDKYATSIENNELQFYSERQYKELQSWIWKNGRYDHEDNAHDDIIMAGAIGNWLRTHLIKIDYFEEKSLNVQKLFNNVNKEENKKRNSVYAGLSFKKKQMIEQQKYAKVGDMIINLEDLHNKN